MLFYDHIFHREMYSMICQTGRPLSHGTNICDVTDRMYFFGEKIVKINFNNYLLLNVIELVHIFFSTSTNKHISYYLISAKKLYGFYPECLFKRKKICNALKFTSTVML